MDSLRKVIIPSQGYLTGGVKEFLLDAIGFEQEKKIFSSITEEAVDQVLSECIKSPENFDVSTLTPQDRDYLLYQLRIHSYGDEYHIKVKEGNQWVEKVVSLEDMDVVDLEEVDATISGTLPVKGDSVTIAFPTVGQIRKARDFAREKSEKLGVDYKSLNYEYSKALAIGTINGEHKDVQSRINWLKTLKARDLAYIDHLASKARFGYTYKIPVILSNGTEVEASVGITGEFFRPRFED